jgi:hypothetical protein
MLDNKTKNLKNEFSGLLVSFSTISVLDGWYDIVREVFLFINEYNKKILNENDKIKVIQVKQKLGGLRFYTDKRNKEIDDFIEKAIYKSCATCEITGEEGESVFNDTGYIMTLNPKLHELFKSFKYGVYFLEEVEKRLKEDGTI